MPTERALRIEERQLAVVRAAVSDLARRRPRPRQERLAGIHNPWGFAATTTNAWAFLDLCEHEAVVENVAALIGPDVILWDSQLYLSAARYFEFVGVGRERRYWPVAPLAGAVALVAFSEELTFQFADIHSLSAQDLARGQEDAPLYVIRYMPATSRFIRDPKAPANWIAMEEQPLINYMTRPLWLVRGADRAGNDFVTGFSCQAPRWAAH